MVGRFPTWLEVRPHFHTYAGVTLDRVYLLSNSLWRFDMRLIGLEELHHAMGLGRGVLLIGAHVGSFDALRAVGTHRRDVTMRVVLDADHSPALSAILKQLNPQIAAGIINPRKDGTAVALEIGAALNQGALVTMLGDRARPGNATTTVDFLGQPAEFPMAPWQIAAALHVPIVLCVGLYRGGTGTICISRYSRSNCRSTASSVSNSCAKLYRTSPTGSGPWYASRPITGSTSMTSGTTCRLAVIGLTLAATTLHAADPDVDALLARLARPAPDWTGFVEVRYSSLLEKPIVVSGRLEHRENGPLVRHVESPYEEVTELQGENVSVERAGSKPRRFRLHRAPELRGMLASFGAILKGDRQMLDQYFVVTAQGSDARWEITRRRETTSSSGACP